MQQWYSNRGTVFSVVRAATVATQRCAKHISAATNSTTTIEELCFLCGPCRNVITGRFRAQSLERTGPLTVGRNMRLDSTSSCLRCNKYESKKNGSTVGGGALNSVRLEFVHQGISDGPSRVRRRVRITSTVALRVVGSYEKGTQCLGV
jgi:hypothetical protein